MEDDDDDSEDEVEELVGSVEEEGSVEDPVVSEGSVVASVRSVLVSEDVSVEPVVVVVVLPEPVSK